MKARLDAAAKQSGRSQSQEAEFRLELSFERQDLLRDALINAFGSELAGLLMMLGLGALNAGLHQHWMLPVRYRDYEGKWIDDPAAYDQGVQAINLILEAYRPGGKVSKKLGSEPSAEIIVHALIHTIKSKKRDSWDWHDPFAQPLADAIGALIDLGRLKEPR